MAKTEFTRGIGRRELLKQGAGIIAGSALIRGGSAAAQTTNAQPGSTLKFFPGFKPLKIKTSTGIIRSPRVPSGAAPSDGGVKSGPIRNGLIASRACRLPITPQSAPITPASPQLGTLPSAGGSGKRHR